MDFKTKANVTFGASLRRGAPLAEGARVKGQWDIVCRAPDGSVKWRESYQNVVTDEGQDYLLDVGLTGAAQSTTWYVGLVDGASPTIAETDTLASSSWTENEAYSEASRVTWSDGGVSGQSVDNSGSVASFSIDTNSQTIGGAFLADDNTKGGTTGTLYAVGTFSSAKSADSGDTLEVTATFTMANDGA